ncbi:uncharacterized protein L3040_005872 [Drepanopeziza brunnea f. sp. 'multigermtubi']|uniref:uncharacterized protein n=1 Tax=Drepanopeziza brunnea f. sp. 'multigermtubi' TaxID=698441 RepID=UPI00239E917E|nr:hypothetical protein L3040_005872 [Drepanopeziza brunnea f. sp. 'multigermtubi']
MPLAFLQVFPREIRDQIYTHALSTQSGAVTLSPWTVEVAKSLALLRTSIAELLDRDELEWVASSAKALGDWARYGRLESITIVAEWDKPKDLQEFKEIQNMRKYGEVLDGRLYKDSSTWTRMIVNTGWPRFCNWGKQKWFREMLMDPGGINELLLELHEAFGGGRLYVDGLLCFKDHLQVAEGYHVDPRNGEIRIVPGACRQVQ